MGHCNTPFPSFPLQLALIFTISQFEHFLAHALASILLILFEYIGLVEHMRENPTFHVGLDVFEVITVLTFFLFGDLLLPL